MNDIAFYKITWPTYRGVAGFMLLVLTLAGCAVSPLQPNSPLQQETALEAGPELGIATDLNLQVTGLQPGSTAEKLDIQIGDTLIDLRWLQSAMSEDQEGGVVLDEEGRPTYQGVVITQPVAMPAATLPPEQYVEMDAIPFTELQRIVSLIGYGFPLELRLLRDGQEITIQITPDHRTQPLMDLPKRIDPEKHAYYYF